MDEFFFAFWPNLAATLVGVVLGVPIALWVNRIADGAAKNAELSDKKKQLLNACNVIESVLKFNYARVVQYPEILRSRQIAWNLGLNTTTWHAVSVDFSSELTPPELRSRMSHQFGNVATLLWLNEQFLSFSFGVNASMSNASTVKDSLSLRLVELCDLLTAETDALLKMTTDLKASLEKK